MSGSNFNPSAFAENLARNAGEFIPADFSQPQRNYVSKKLFDFCNMAGDALVNDTNASLSGEQIESIVQMLGEWTFHKSIDLIRANLQAEICDHVLQQVAFAVFEAGKHSQINKFSHSDSLQLVDSKARSCFESVINDLVGAGRIPKEEIPRIMSFSNYDQMNTPAPAATAQQEEELDPEGEKQMRLIATAVLLRQMPQEKVKNILNSFGVIVKQQLIPFLEMPDLEHKFPEAMAVDYLSSLKKLLNSQAGKNTDNQIVMQNNIISRLKDLYTDDEIMASITYERPVVKQYVSYFLNESNYPTTSKPFSQHISGIIGKYIKHKLLK